jgi:hypothetical protein
MNGHSWAEIAGLEKAAPAALPAISAVSAM